MPFLDVFSAVRKELSLLMVDELKKYNFGRSQMLIISSLSRLGDQSMKDLSAITLSDPASTTRTVHSLEKLGWLKRVVDKADQRRTVVRLTPKGQRHSKDVHAIRQAISRRIDRSLDAEEQKQAVALLTKLVETA